MTNNPTIDGVSLLPCPFCGGDAVLKQYRADGLEIRCTGCRSMRQQRWMYKGRDWLETKMIEKWNERAIQAAERQEPVVLLSEHKKGLDAYLEQIKDQQSTIARLEARITQLESEEPEWSAMQQRLGDENAQLRSRIAELESGRGEPVANCFERRNGAGEWINDSNVWLDGIPCSGILKECEKYPDLYRIRLAYAAPPAPVSVVLPERKTFEPPSYRDQFAEGWNACIVATAALNGVKS